MRHSLPLLVIGIVLSLSSCATGGGTTGDYFLAPEIAQQGSLVETDVWTVDAEAPLDAGNRGIWQFSYTAQVPEEQLQEIPIYLPYPASNRGNQGSQSLLGGILTVESSSNAQTYQYWIVHTNTVRWIDAAGSVRCSITNTSDKTADLRNATLEIASVPGVGRGDGLPSSVGPGKTVTFELARIDLSQVSTPDGEPTEVPFRFVDLPISLNPDGSIREISLYEDHFVLTRTSFTYTSGMTLTPVHASGAHINGGDGTAHYISGQTQDTHWSSVTLDPIDTHFPVDIKGAPLVGPEPRLWESRENNAILYDFGNPERQFEPDPNKRIVLLE